jgi:tRNA/tmRNA/rRNA uracil-C5-methylase (TrmA/RlmC/RlmD family)
MEKFQQIKESYKKIHEEFQAKNKLLVKYLDHGVWAPSLPKEIYKIFERYSDKKKTFLDLGSGDGLVVMIAALFFKHATGIELEKEFYDKSEKMNEELQINNITLINDDFFNQDISSYDIMFIAPDKEFSLKLENKFEKELNGLLIVYSSIFQPKTLKQVNHFETHHFDVFIYENKAKKV